MTPTGPTDPHGPQRLEEIERRMRGFQDPVTRQEIHWLIETVRAQVAEIARLTAERDQLRMLLDAIDADTMVRVVRADRDEWKRRYEELEYLGLGLGPPKKTP